jgi:hypothetical protein
MWSIEALGSVVVQPEDPINKCQKAVDETSYELSRDGVEHEVVEGRFEAWRLNEGVGSAYHWYIIVGSDQIRGVEEDIIIDPTISQFLYEDYTSRELDVQVDPRASQRPIITQGDELYEAYRRT